MSGARRLVTSLGRRALTASEEGHRDRLRFQLERARVVYGAVLQARAMKPIPGYPVPLADIESTLREFGVAAGDLVHVQSSLEHLLRGSSVKTAEAELGPMRYASDVVDLVTGLVGSDGTVVMNTDGITHENVFRAWAGQVEPGEALFDYRTTPSRRGLISELFRRRPAAVRSVHPWYNMTAEGALAQDLLRDDVLSTPYAMDEHSSTYKATMRGGKVLLLGSGFDLNVPMHLIEYVHADEFPRPVYVNKPSRMTYVARDDSVQTIDVLLHASMFYVQLGVSTHNFCTYLQPKYDIYRTRAFENGASIVCFDAREQYEASLREMREGVTQYDPRFQVPVER